MTKKPRRGSARGASGPRRRSTSRAQRPGVGAIMKGTQSQDDDLALAEAYLQHELMNEMKDYLDRGRRFERLTIPELNKTWIIAFRRFVAKDRTVIREMDDLAAELRLRNLELPLDSVRAEALQLRDEVKRLGPDAPSDGLDERIRAFLAKRKKPKN